MFIPHPPSSYHSLVDYIWLWFIFFQLRPFYYSRCKTTFILSLSNLSNFTPKYIMTSNKGTVNALAHAPDPASTAGRVAPKKTMPLYSSNNRNLNSGKKRLSCRPTLLPHLLSWTQGKYHSNKPKSWRLFRHHSRHLIPTWLLEYQTQNQPVFTQQKSLF